MDDAMKPPCRALPWTGRNVLAIRGNRATVRPLGFTGRTSLLLASGEIYRMTGVSYVKVRAGCPQRWGLSGLRSVGEVA